MEINNKYNVINQPMKICLICVSSDEFQSEVDHYFNASQYKIRVLLRRDRKGGGIGVCQVMGINEFP